MKLTKKSTYPSYAADVTDDVILRNTNGQVLYWTHPFDIGSITNTKKNGKKITLLMVMCYYKVSSHYDLFITK